MLLLRVEEKTAADRSGDDDALMSRVARGERDAFEALVRKHAVRIVRFCMKQTGDAAAGEEMAQEVWLSVWRHRADYRAEGRFVVWLFTRVLPRRMAISIISRETRKVRGAG